MDTMKQATLARLAQPSHQREQGFPTPEHAVGHGLLVLAQLLALPLEIVAGRLNAALDPLRPALDLRAVSRNRGESFVIGRPRERYV
ncbi:hypothetical protein, partial [Vibrio parahaemolyticus]|uniref:hypothetical protein n=1 Tax=Vibrio parahaemolyticus TaxID=670 RepID=UPI00211447B2